MKKKCWIKNNKYFIFKIFFFYNNLYMRVFNIYYNINFLNVVKVRKKSIKKLYLTHLQFYKKIKRRNWKFHKRYSKFYRRLLKYQYFIGYTYFIRFYCIYFFWYLFYYNKFYFYYNRILFNLWVRFFSITSLFENLTNNIFYSYNLLYKNLNYFYKSSYYFEFENMITYYLNSVYKFYYNINNNKMILQDIYLSYQKYIYVIFYNYFKWYYNDIIYYNNKISYNPILNKLPRNDKMFFDFYYNTNYKCKVLYNIDYFRIVKFKSKPKYYRKKNILQIIKKNTNVLLI